MTGRAYLWPKLAEIRQGMSEVLDKQVNSQKESLKNISRVHTSSRKPTKAHEKVCDENKNDACVKVLFMEGSPL